MNCKSSFFLAVLLNLPFFLLYVIWGQVCYGSLDDYFMSGVLTGAYGGEYDVHFYFVNSAYGYFLKPFYCLFPKVSWYFIFELLGMFSAFTTITYILIKQQGFKWGLTLSFLFLASLTLDFYFQVGFTRCSTLYTATGLSSLLLGVSEGKKKYLTLGGLFFLAGSVMRYQGFLLGLPYLTLFLLIEHRLQKLFTTKNMIALCLIATAIYCIRVNDRNLYTESEYRYYAQYQPIRAYFGDGAFYDKEATYDELEERGMSGIDFYFLKSWFFYDTEVFDIDSLTTIKQVAQNNLYYPNYKRMLIAFLMAVSNAFTRPSGWCWFAICILMILGRSKKLWAYPWISFGIIGFSIGYLLLANRLVYRVESGIWLYAIVSAIPLLPRLEMEKESTFSQWSNLFLTVVFLISASIFAKEIYIHEWSKTSELPAEWAAFVKHAQEHPNDVFLLSFERYKSLGMFKGPAYKAIEPGSWNNIFSLGYWNIHLPAMKKELHKRGVSNPMRDIVHNNVYVLEEGNIPSLGDYYERHYHQVIKGDTTQTFGKLLLFKYHEIEPTEGEIHE